MDNNVGTPSVTRFLFLMLELPHTKTASTLNWGAGISNTFVCDCNHGQNLCHTQRLLLILSDVVVIWY